jgi:hypothetical protein
MIISTLKDLIRPLFRLVGLLPVKQFPFVVRGKIPYPYRKPRNLSKVLDSNFFAPISLTSTSEYEEVKANSLYQIWAEIPGSHKWMHYFKPYQNVISHFDKQPIRMLEIGVYKGGSLKMWRNYLGPESIIVGIDIDSSCQQFERQKENVFVRIGDQSNQKFLGEVIQEFGPFDFILDDGSHICSHMIASFNYLFLCGLKNGGIYMAEDTHSNFWPEFRDSSYSFLDLSKDLVDLMHAHYWEHHSERSFRKDHSQRVEKISVPRICSEISEIKFNDSLVTIYKNKKMKIPISVHL